MSAWHRYWFDDGGRHALAIVRIAVATSVLLVLHELSTLPQLVAPAAVYRPVGIWMLLGHSPPPHALVVALWAVAGASTVAMLVGFHARASTALSFVSALALASLSFSSTPTWSHGYNVVFLAQLALLGGRVGDAVSIDALRAPIRVERGYQWSLRLVQLAVGLMFASACFHKLRAGGFTLAWATSDNLRHHLLARYDLAGLERSAIADWLLAESWRYQAAAIGNLVTQASPLLAIMFVRRPWVRLAVAVLFLVEGIAIDQLLGLPNPHWLPLAAVFVDWDYFLKRPQPPARPWQPPRRVHVFIACFVLYDLVLSTVPKLDHRLNTYPFTAFQMFATVRAAKPWSEHLPYVMYGDAYSADRTIDQRYVDHEYRFMYQTTDPGKLAARLGVVRTELGVAMLRHELAMFVAPAYPAPARFEKRPIAITAEVTAAGVRTLLGSASSTTIELRPQGVATTDVRLYAYLEQTLEPRPLAATRDGNRFTLAEPLPARTEHVVAETDGARWLVWSKRARR